MLTLREAAQQALEAMESDPVPLNAINNACAFLRAALAEPTVPSDCADSHQPVAWRVRGYNQFKTGKPLPWRYFDGAGEPAVNTPDCCDFEQFYAAPLNLNDPAVQKRLAAQWGYAPQRKPLTEEQVDRAYQEIWRDSPDDFGPTAGDWIEAGIRYAERAHGIGDDK